MRTKHWTTVGFLTIALGTSLAAHHSFTAEFDVTKPVTLKGSVTKVEWGNPHIWVYLDVKDEGGTVVTWMIEGGSPNQLIKQGVTKHTLAIGTEIMIEGYQAKDGTNKGVGRNLVLADGRRLFLGGDANSSDKKPGGE